MTTVRAHNAPSPEQAQAALARAHWIKDRFFAWKRDVARADRRTGLAEVADVLEQGPCWLAPWRLDRVLRGVRRVGVEQARSLLRRCRIAERARVRDLTDDERRALVAELRACARTGVVGVLACPSTKRGGSHG